MKKFIAWLLDPPVFGAPAIIWIRLLTGGVFFWEGLLKFTYPNQGVGRFMKLGFPFPESNYLPVSSFCWRVQARAPSTGSCAHASR